MAETEESLGSSLDRQISKFNDVQQTMKGMAAELSRLKDNCVTLKQERARLSSECAQRELDRSSLLEQVAALKSERDILRQEVGGSLGERLQNAPSGSSIPFDPQGKLKRKLWTEEQKNAELLKKISDMDGEKAEAVENAREVARGLRSRIGELEEKVRISMLRAEETDKDRAALEKRSRDEEAHLKSLFRQKTAELNETLGRLKEANQRIDKVVVENDGLTAKLIEKESSIKAEVVTPRKALQPRPANSVILTRPQSPATPTKGKVKHTAPTSPALFSPTTSLAKRYAHLEAQHEALRAEYDKLRARHAEDLKHWKEYKALELARREIKIQRKADRKAAEKERAATPMETAPGLPGPSRSTMERPRDQAPTPDLPHDSPLPSQESGKLVSASEGSQALSQPVKQPPPAQKEVPLELDETDNDDPPEVDYESETDLLAEPPQTLARPSSTLARPGSTSKPQNQDTPVQSHPADRTLRARPSPTKKRLDELLKEGRWLGGDRDRTQTSKGSSSKTKKRARSNTPDEKVFALYDNMPGSYTMETPTTHRTPLVRDRGAGTSTLRQSVVQDSVPKRKRGDLEGLTPSQKTRELKRLSSLTGVEKREYYAEYKGKGRYVPPESVESRVEDEYEIDPKQNEGANFQFHDVKRRKEDRQKMHGTDCECCREYYEAVGPLPKLNQGPKWKDGPEDDARPTDDVRDHQNKVSRHRETWQRNPTPPGYWEIGFPSTQKAEEQNVIADEMNKQRARQLRQEAEQKDSKWRKKKTSH